MVQLFKKGGLKFGGRVLCGALSDPVILARS